MLIISLIRKGHFLMMTILSERDIVTGGPQNPTVVTEIQGVHRQAIAMQVAIQQHAALHAVHGSEWHLLAFDVDLREMFQDLNVQLIRQILVDSPKRRGRLHRVTLSVHVHGITIVGAYKIAVKLVYNSLERFGF